VPGSDWDDSTGPEADEIEPEIEPESEAAGETADERFSRGRSGRRHGRRDEDRGEKSREHVPVTFDDDGDEFEDGEKSLAGTGDSEPDVGSASEDETDDESGEHIINYENVPTWEEAISYLLHPSQVQVDSGTGSGASPRGSASADQPRQTRHIGHRKNRR
jgi:hypothetical protein